MQIETLLDNCYIDRLVQVLAMHHSDFNFPSNYSFLLPAQLINTEESRVGISSRTEIKVRCIDA